MIARRGSHYEIIFSQPAQLSDEFSFFATENSVHKNIPVQVPFLCHQNSPRFHNSFEPNQRLRDSLPDNLAIF